MNMHIRALKHNKVPVAAVVRREIRQLHPFRAFDYSQPRPGVGELPTAMATTAPVCLVEIETVTIDRPSAGDNQV
jgi:hypothetical protein